MPDLGERNRSAAEHRRFGNIPYLFSVSQYTQFALNLALSLFMNITFFPNLGG